MSQKLQWDRQKLVETWFFHLRHNFASPGLVLVKQAWSNYNLKKKRKIEQMVSQKRNGNGSVRESPKKRTWARSVASAGGAVTFGILPSVAGLPV